MDIITSILNLTIVIIILILTFSTFYLPVVIYQNMSRYKEAALGLIFTNLDRSVNAFKVYAVAVLIFAIGRIIDLINIIPSSSSIDNFATLLYLITDVLLIYAFYKLFIITRIEK